MTNNSSLYNHNERNSALAVEEQSDAFSSFATAEVVSLPNQYRTSTDNRIEAALAAQFSEPEEAYSEFKRSKRYRKSSSIL